MSITNGFAGVSNCYVFKSRLQEYAQKESFPTPVYETVKEGPSHQPYFHSTVTVNNVTYKSLPGFFNRKASEQSAAEIALLELAKSGITNESITNPVHETGLCKNLLQEYAQKMNYAIPTYTCFQKETQGSKRASFSCTVDIGGIQYIGATASSKKEAEIKAARTALIAIQSSSNETETKSNSDCKLTVVPTKKKVQESEVKKEKIEKPLKPKNVAFKKKMAERKKLFRKKGKITGNTDQDGEKVDSVIPNGDVNLGPENNLVTVDNSEKTVVEMAEAENVSKEAEQTDMVVEAENVERVEEQTDAVVEAENVPAVDVVIKSEIVERVAEPVDMLVEAENVQRVEMPADVVVKAEIVEREGEESEVPQELSLSG